MSASTNGKNGHGKPKAKRVENNGKSNGHAPGGVTGKGFTPGKSGNPGGRPKTAEFSQEVRTFLRERVKDKTRLRLMLERLAKDDPKVLLYYGFGKPQENVSLTGDLTVDELRPLKDVPTDRLRAIAADYTALLGREVGNGGSHK